MRLSLLAVAAVVAAPACSLERSGLDPDGVRDAGTDGAPRDGARRDTGGDDAAPPDAGGEDATGFDAGEEDAGFDAGGEDAGFDAGFDAGEDERDAGFDAGFDAGLPPCDDLYGRAAGYVLCEETETECTFGVSLSGSTCGALCPMFGGTCIRALDDGAPCVPFGGMDTCDTPRSTETCTCSRAVTPVPPSKP